MDKYLDCGNPKCGFARIRCPDCGTERVISFSEDHKVIDRIIHHLKLGFYAERPPPLQVIQQELLMAAEERGEVT